MGLARLGRDPPQTPPTVTHLKNPFLMPQISFLMPKNQFLMLLNSFLDSKLKPRSGGLTIYGFYHPKI
jgi:hypothetical protein